MTKFKDSMVKLFKIGTILCFSLMIIISFLQVIFRYVFGNSLIWSEEFARYMYIWAVMMGAVVALDWGVHMEVDIITASLKDNTKKILRSISWASILFFISFAAYYGIILVNKTMDQPSPAMRIPMAYVYLSIPVGCAGMFLVSIEKLISMYKKSMLSLDKKEGVTQWD